MSKVRSLVFFVFAFLIAIDSASSQEVLFWSSAPMSETIIATPQGVGGYTSASTALAFMTGLCTPKYVLFSDIGAEVNLNLACPVHYVMNTASSSTLSNFAVIAQGYATDETNGFVRGNAVASQACGKAASASAASYTNVCTQPLPPPTGGGGGGGLCYYGDDGGCDGGGDGGDDPL